jgi:hypothetical protein
MTQRFRICFAGLAAIALCAAMADTASAWGRRGGGSNGSNGSWGGNGSNGGSWGSNGSNGSNGSFGGLFSRHRNRGSNGSNGSWGSNGSHGGYVSNGSCGSHGGAYSGNHIEREGTETTSEGEGHQASADSQREVRYYGSTESRDSETQQSATSAPPMNQGDQAPSIGSPQNSSNASQSGARESSNERTAPPAERSQSGT